VLDQLRGELPIFERMAQCQQEPDHHAEGDVLIHTQMVCDALVSDPAWASLDADEREDLWLAAVLHDCGKPQTTREEDGRLRAPGHAAAGAVLARGLLWQAGIAPAQRERICALVRWHMTPYHLLDRPDSLSKAIELSLDLRADHLALLVRADAAGRITTDSDHVSGAVELFVEYCEEVGVLSGPYPFASDHARVEYFRRAGRAATYAAFDDTRCEVTLTVGLPGAGKDHWIAENAGGGTVISLDDLRRARGARRTDKKAQGQVIAAAREALRVELRASRDVIWNATNLSRQQREPLLGLAADYNARVRIVCVEAAPEQLRRQNRDRPHPVREDAIGRLLGRWEYPTLTEAHQLISVG
jgi:predicted kinase